MHFRDVLLTLKTYPEPTAVSAIEPAILLADAIGARISAIACEVHVQTPGRIGVITDALLDVPAMVAAEIRKSADNARDLLATFAAEAERAGILQDKIIEKCLASQVPDLLVEHARLRDLTIIPIPEADSVDQWYAEAVIFGSGHPAVVMPETVRRPPGADTVVVAWDFSRPAARAVWDALAILQRAKKVHVVTVTNEKAIDSTRSGEELAKHLSRHGVTVVLEEIDAAGRTVGEALEAHLVSRNADLLVMGAYGHSRVREFILGGATRSMLARPPLPVFLSH
jgi:nucleotide-binding universal stress UspA family protein